MSIINSLGFDPYAMVKPKTQADLTMLLDEALAEANNLLEAFTHLGETLEQHRQRKQAGD